MTMDISLFVWIATTALAWLTAMAALWNTRSARREAREAQAAAAAMAERIEAIEQTLTERVTHVEAQLAERRHAIDTRTRPGLREAVALSRHGASTDELVSTCRIGRSEAQLIQLLHGATRDVATPTTGAGVH